MRCTLGQKAISAYQMEEKQIIGPLRAIIEAHGRLYYNTKHSKNTVQLRDSATKLFEVFERFERVSEL
jgi:hypothetical protein